MSEDAINMGTHYSYQLGRRKEGNVLFNDALNTFYGYMASIKDHMGYSFRFTAKVLLYAPSHRYDRSYHGLGYTSRGALAGTKNSSTSERSYHGATSMTEG